MDIRTNRKKRTKEYLVKWIGWNELTWESEANVKNVWKLVEECIARKKLLEGNKKNKTKK